MWPCDLHRKKVQVLALDQQVQIPQLVWDEQVLRARNSHVASAARERSKDMRIRKALGPLGHGAIHSG